jgi:hypothetical protein
MLSLGYHALQAGMCGRGAITEGERHSSHIPKQSSSIDATLPQHAHLENEQPLSGGSISMSVSAKTRGSCSSISGLHVEDSDLR